MIHRNLEATNPLCRSARECRLVFVVAGTLCILSCGSARTSACINPAGLSEGPCTMEYNPVCGCDEKTYGNPCQAGRAGLTSWKQGECVTQ